MTGSPHADDLDLALSLMDVADAMTMDTYGKAGLKIETKPDATFVTEADQAVEHEVRARITKARSGDAVVGEEFGTTGSGNRRWIIDPIDGTHNFMRRIPVWATLLALEVDGEMTVGVVSAPSLGRRWWAAKDRGAYASSISVGGKLSDPFPISVSQVSNLADAQISSCGPGRWIEEGLADNFSDLVKKCWRDRDFGDFWSHMLVAEGACDVGLDPTVSLWDLAALQVIVEEAGGTFTDFAGNARADGGSAISTNGLLHKEVLALVGTPKHARDAARHAAS